jgi:hypothetical protein
MEMVVSEWLLDCAAEGRRVQEGLHRPDGDVTLLELPAAGPTQAPGGMTQMGVTQLQQTQTQVGGWLRVQALGPAAVLCYQIVTFQMQQAGAGHGFGAPICIHVFVFNSPSLTECIYMAR